MLFYSYSVVNLFFVFTKNETERIICVCMYIHLVQFYAGNAHNSFNGSIRSVFYGNKKNEEYNGVICGRPREKHITTLAYAFFRDRRVTLTLIP